MTPERWKQVRSVFEAALDLAGAERTSFIEEACRGDVSLKQEVGKLFDSFDGDSRFMESAAVNEVATQILDSTTPARAGQKVGGYTILGKIGSGGMGDVYLASDSDLDRKVAIKFLNAEYGERPEGLERFIREAKLASSLNHPNILVIHAVGDEAGSRYIVSEYVEGKTLRKLIDSGHLTIAEVVGIVTQIAEALAAAHTVGLIHRDIKPENIIVRPDGYIKVLDFGLAKLVAADGSPPTASSEHTAPGLIMGTIHYMSPEQARGEAVDTRTDIFSLGTVLYEMLTGTKPFKGGSMSDVLADLLRSDPRPVRELRPGVPAELESIVGRMLSKQLDARYGSIAEVVTELGSIEIPGNAKRRAIGSASPVTADVSKSIAVLPFVNMSADPENDFFCDGLAEELIIGLAKVRELRVAARTSTFSFKGRNASVAEIGRALNVGTILEGSVRRSADRVRVALQLVSVADGYPIWSERYDAQLKDIFDLQDEIALSIIDKLTVSLASSDRAALKNRYANNVEAYELYLKGRYHFLKLTPVETERGIKYFEQALSIDPEYALAYAGLSAALVTLPLTSDGNPDEYFPNAKTAGLKALELDPNLAEAHAALFWVALWYDWDWDKAELHGHRAVENNPNIGDGHEALAHAFGHLARYDEALAEMRLAREMDPLHLRINALDGQLLGWAGRYDDAIDRLQHTLELEPRFWLAHHFLSGIYICKEMYTEAIAAAERARDLSGSTHPLSFLGYALAKSGDEAGAREVLRQLVERRGDRYVPAPNIATIHNGLGDTGQALTWLERGVEERDPRIAFLKVEPKWNNLRSEPRFKKMIAAVGFEPDVDGTIVERAYTHPDPSGTISQDVKRTAGLRTYLIPIVLISLIAAIAIGGSFWWFRAGGPAAPATGSKKALAVLPFANSTQDADAEYLADGLSGSIIDNLSQLSALRVLSRNSSFRFRGDQSDTARIGSQLGVDAIVTGDIKKLADKYVISVRLVNASDDTQIWGDQFVKGSTDIIAVQNEIAQAVAQNLRVRLTPTDEQKIVKVYTRNAEAYQLYMRGQFLIFKLRPDQVEKGIVDLQKAIALDPNYAMAYAGLSGAYRSLALGAEISPVENLERSADAARKALDLDPGLAEGYSALATCMMWGRWDWSGAEAQFRRAIDLDPGSATTHIFYSQLLSVTGRHAEALSEAQRAVEIEPLWPLAGSIQGLVMLNAGETDEAITKLRRVYDIDPGFWMPHLFAARGYIDQELYEQAVAEARRTTELGPAQSLQIAYESYALAKLGRRGEAVSALDRLVKRSSERYVPPYHFAFAYLGLGDREKALSWLERGYQEHDPKMVFLKVDPKWRELANEPRYVEMLRKMNF